MASKTIGKRALSKLAHELNAEMKSGEYVTESEVEAKMYIVEYLASLIGFEINGMADCDGDGRFYLYRKSGEQWRKC